MLRRQIRGTRRTKADRLPAPRSSVGTVSWGLVHLANGDGKGARGTEGGGILFGGPDDGDVGAWASDSPGFHRILSWNPARVPAERCRLESRSPVPPWHQDRRPPSGHERLSFVHRLRKDLSKVRRVVDLVDRDRDRTAAGGRQECRCR